MSLAGVLGLRLAPVLAGNPPDICQINPCSSGCPLEGTPCCQCSPACCNPPPGSDCNGNGSDDACDLDSVICVPYSRDCNNNDVPDECDASLDCDYAEFVYDALGRRIAKVDHAASTGDVTTRYYYDGQNVIEETDETGTLKRYFVNGTQYIDERVLMHYAWTTPTEYYYLERELHTVSGLASAGGAYAEWYAYGAYGDVKVMHPSGTQTPKSAVGNPYYFTGRELDFVEDVPAHPKQVYHYRARSYDAENGRFRQRDPLETGPHGSDRIRLRDQYDDGANLYQYARGTPTNHVDPLGLSTQCGTRSCLCCQAGARQVNVYGDSARAKAIIEAGFGKGAGGCVTLLNWFGTGAEIYCTMSCKDIKSTYSYPRVRILDHECCHACDYFDKGVGEYLGGAIHDTCNSRPSRGSQTW